MSGSRGYLCLRCGIPVYEWRGLCRDCLHYAKSNREMHLWSEPRDKRRERMRFLNDIGYVPNVIAIDRERRRRRDPSDLPVALSELRLVRHDGEG